MYPFKLHVRSDLKVCVPLHVLCGDFIGILDDEGKTVAQVKIGKSEEAARERTRFLVQAINSGAPLVQPGQWRE